MRHAAFLRGLNVGGHRVTNAELAAVFTAVGLLDAEPYQASGNVVFGRFDERPVSELESDIGAALAAAFGYEVPAIVRSASEVAALADAEPFPASIVEQTEGRVQVMLLARDPDPAAREAIDELCPADEHLRFDDRVMFWLPRATISGSTFAVSRVERVLGVCTMRTQGTLQRIAKRFFGPSE